MTPSIVVPDDPWLSEDEVTPADTTLSAFAEQCRQAAAANVRLAELAFSYVSECVRADPSSRPDAIRALAATMREHGVFCGRGDRHVIRANGLVRAHALVAVFGETFDAAVPWHLRMRLAPLVRREAGAEEERWHALPGVEEQCRELVVRTARGELHRKAVTPEVNRLRGLAPRPKHRTPRELLDACKKSRRKPRRPAVNDHPLRGVVMATPKDAAAMLARAVSDHPDPDVVARHLLRELMRCPGLSEQTRSAVRAAVSETDGRVSVA